VLPRSKVSMMIMRPPHRGMAHRVVSVRSSDRSGVGGEADCPSTLAPPTRLTQSRRCEFATARWAIGQGGDDAASHDRVAILTTGCLAIERTGDGSSDVRVDVGNWPEAELPAAGALGFCRKSTLASGRSSISPLPQISSACLIPLPLPGLEVCADAHLIGLRPTRGLDTERALKDLAN
jgi:hypothetical protein